MELNLKEGSTIKKKLKKNIVIVDTYKFLKRRIDTARFIKENLKDSYMYLRYSGIRKKNEEQISYNLLLITHSLEKGLLHVDNPRAFGNNKVRDVLSLLNEWSNKGYDTNHFSYNHSISMLKKWSAIIRERTTDKDYINLCNKIDENFINFEEIDTGSKTVKLKDLKKEHIDFVKFAKTRFSARRYQKRDILQEDFDKALEAAISAPSACNRQMIKIYNANSEQSKTEVYKFVQSKRDIEYENVNFLLVTFDYSSLLSYQERNQGMLNAGLFSMNLVNALHSLDIGSCFYQVGNNQKEKKSLKKRLGISNSEDIAVIIGCGYYLDETLAPVSARKEIKQIFSKI